jgi:hypothetical protein
MIAQRGAAEVNFPTSRFDVRFLKDGGELRSIMATLLNSKV